MESYLETTMPLPNSQLSTSLVEESPTFSLPNGFRRRTSKSFSQVSLTRQVDPTIDLIQTQQELPSTFRLTDASADQQTITADAIKQFHTSDTDENTNDCPSWNQETERERSSSDISSTTLATSISINNVRGSPSACLFVASLSASRSEDELAQSVTDHFKKWGKLLNVKVLKDWMHRPYSFVQFEDGQDASKALVEAHNTTIDGRHIRVEQARVNRTLFIAKSGMDLTNEKVREIVAVFGKIESIRLVRGDPTGRHQISAFVKFFYRDDAVRAYTLLRRDSSYVIEWGQNFEKESTPFVTIPIDRFSIFVGQLNSDSVSREGLEEKFLKYGKITEIHLVNKKTPTYQGVRPAFAFIRYEDENSADKAVAEENGKVYLDQTIRVQHRELHDHADKMYHQHFRYHSDGAVYASPPYAAASGRTGLGYPVSYSAPNHPIFAYNMAYGDVHHPYLSHRPPPGLSPHQQAKSHFVNKVMTTTMSPHQQPLHHVVAAENNLPVSQSATHQDVHGLFVPKNNYMQPLSYAMPPALGPNGQGIYFAQPSPPTPPMMSPHSPMLMIDSEGRPVDPIAATTMSSSYPVYFTPTAVNVPSCPGLETSQERQGTIPSGLTSQMLVQGPDGLVYPWFGTPTTVLPTTSGITRGYNNNNNLGPDTQQVQGNHVEQTPKQSQYGYGVPEPSVGLGHGSDMHGYVIQDQSAKLTNSPDQTELANSMNSMNPSNVTMNVVSNKPLLSVPNSNVDVDDLVSSSTITPAVVVTA